LRSARRLPDNGGAAGAQDNDTCLSYGAKHGSDAYVRCRTDLQRDRAIESAATQPVFADPMAGPWRAGPMFCHRSAFGVRCF
jgi:hypothetical protein